MKKPNLFIVGHPRSGTSSLHYYLKQHPDIYMTAIKEPNFFARDFRKDSDNFHKKPLYFPYRTENRYLKLYKNRQNEKIAGEASATNLCSKVSARQIYSFNPDAKIIMMLREPVDFLYSYHSAARFALGEHYEDFKTALSAETERRKGRNLSKRVITPSWLYYSEFIKYADQLARFISQFGRHQVKVVIFDDFKKDTESIYREILEYLGVAADFRPDFEIINPNKQPPQNFLKRNILDSPYFRKSLRFLISDRMYAKMKDFYKDRLVTHEARPPLNEELRNDLMKVFKVEVERISDSLQKNLVSLWGYDKL